MDNNSFTSAVSYMSFSVVSCWNSTGSLGWVGHVTHQTFRTLALSDDTRALLVSWRLGDLAYSEALQGIIAWCTAPSSNFSLHSLQLLRYIRSSLCCSHGNSALPFCLLTELCNLHIQIDSASRDSTATGPSSASARLPCKWRRHSLQGNSWPVCREISIARQNERTRRRKTRDGGAEERTAERVTPGSRGVLDADE